MENLLLNYIVTTLFVLPLGAIIVWLIYQMLKNPAYGVFLLIFFLPFERLPTIPLFGLTVRINNLLGGGLFLIWLITILARRRRLIPQPVTPLLVLFSATLLISMLSAPNFSRALMVTAITILMISTAFLVTQLLTDRRQLRPALVILGITTFVAVLFGLYQFVGDLAGLSTTITGLIPGYSKITFGFPRIQSFSPEPLYFGNFLLLPISVGIAMLTLAKSGRFRRYLIIFLILTLIALGLTLSRGALIGAFGAVLVLGFIFKRELINVQNFRLAAIGLTIISIMVITLISIAGPGTKQRFISQITLQDFGKSESTSGRLRDWQLAIDIWKTSPIFGVGPGNYGPSLIDEQSPDKTDIHWPIVNNEYLELLAETGVVGLGIFLSLLLLTIHRSAKAFKAARSDPLIRALLGGLTAAVIGILIQYNFFSTLYITQIWITFGLLWAVQSIALQRVKNESSN